MKKIMFMVNGLSGGGAEKILQTLLKNIDRKKYEITLYSLHYDSNAINLYPSDIEYKYLYGYKKSNFMFDHIKEFFDKIKGKMFNILPPSLFHFMYIRGKYDIEVAFIEGESTKIVSGLCNKHSKKYAWVHIDLINNPWTNIVYKSLKEEIKCYSKFDKVLCVSSSVKEAFDKKYHTGNSAIQYNPVDEKEIIIKSKELLIKKQADLQLVSLGRLVPQKGYDRLVKCVKKIKDKGYDNFNIWILGDGEQREALEKYIKDYELEKYITLLGFKSNPYPYIAASDAFICSSRSEGFSTVATEALILEKPIFTVDCAGMKELFGSYDCGRIVENDEESLCELLQCIVSKKYTISDFESAVSLRRKDFTLEKRLNEMQYLFN